MMSKFPYQSPQVSTLPLSGGKWYFSMDLVTSLLDEFPTVLYLSMKSMHWLYTRPFCVFLSSVVPVAAAVLNSSYTSVQEISVHSNSRTVRNPLLHTTSKHSVYIFIELEQRGMIEILLASQLQQDDSCPGPLDWKPNVLTTTVPYLHLGDTIVHKTAPLHLNLSALASCHANSLHP